MTSRELFEFVTDSNITKENIQEYLANIQAKVVRRQGSQMSANEKAELQVSL